MLIDHKGNHGKVQPQQGQGAKGLDILGEGKGKRARDRKGKHWVI